MSEPRIDDERPISRVGSIQKGPIVSKGELIEKVLRNAANGPGRGASRDRSAGRGGRCKLPAVDDVRAGGHGSKC
jgi:hypothetical protein